MQDFASEFVVLVLAVLCGGYIFSLLFRTRVMQPFFGNANIRLSQIQQHLSFIQEQIAEESNRSQTIQQHIRRHLRYIQEQVESKQLLKAASICLSCGRVFESRTKLFEHLAATPKHEV